VDTGESSMSQTNLPPSTRRDTSYDGHESSESIKRRIDGTREAMDETLDELGERLNPHSLLDDAMEIFRSPQAKDTAKKAGEVLNDFAQSLGRQVRDNPIPTLLVGAGLAWLAFSGQNGDEVDSREFARRQRMRLRRAGGREWDDEYWDDEEESFYTDDD